MIKKIRGRVRFFVAWDDPDAALQNYLRQAPDLHASRKSRPATLSADGVTVKQVVNYPEAKEVRCGTVETGLQSPPIAQFFELDDAGGAGGVVPVGGRWARVGSLETD